MHGKQVTSQMPSVDGRGYFRPVLTAEARPAAPCRLRFHKNVRWRRRGLMHRSGLSTAQRVVYIWRHRALREHEIQSTFQTPKGEVRREDTQCRRVAVPTPPVASAAGTSPPVLHVYCYQAV